MKILIIEDDYALSELILDITEDFGYNALAVHNAEDGADVLVSNHYDLIILDFSLPDRNAFELISDLKNDNILIPPFIMITGHGDETIAVKMMKLGARDYIIKDNAFFDMFPRVLKRVFKEIENENKIKLAEEELKQKNLELTRQKQLLEELNDNLEDKVYERTAELEAAKIKLSNLLEKEKEFGDIKSNFISMISHEFRTPLTVISTSSALINSYHERANYEKLNKQINRIDNSVDELTKLMENIVTFNKSQSSFIPVNKELVNIKELIEEFIEEFWYSYNVKQKINISYKCNRNSMLSDRKILKQVLLQLLLNAVKFSSEDSSINFHILYKDNYHIIRVIDEGIGISEEDQKIIFDPFTKNTNQIGISPGNGIGLSIAKRFVEALQGRIYVKSTLGQGSVFSIYLPAVAE